jgi:hypothetical protein
LRRSRPGRTAVPSAVPGRRRRTRLLPLRRTTAVDRIGSPHRRTQAHSAWHQRRGASGEDAPRAWLHHHVRRKRVPGELASRPQACQGIVTDPWVCCQFSAGIRVQQDEGREEARRAGPLSSCLVRISLTQRLPCQQRSVASETSLTRHTP